MYCSCCAYLLMLTHVGKFKLPVHVVDLPDMLYGMKLLNLQL